VPCKEPVKVPVKFPLKLPEVDPIVTTSSPLEPDFFIKAKPSFVFSAISPNSKDPVSGILPGTEERRNFKY
jgi:hypothetical protein